MPKVNLPSFRAICFQLLVRNQEELGVSGVASVASQFVLECESAFHVNCFTQYSTRFIDYVLAKAWVAF